MTSPYFTFQGLTKLRILDLAGNPLGDGDIYKKKLMNTTNALISMELENPEQEREDRPVRRTGKVLTLEFVEKNCEDMEKETSFDWSDNQFQMIALDRNALEK